MCDKTQLAIKSQRQGNQLSYMITIWQTEIHDDCNGKLTKAMLILHAVLYVAHELESQRAVLLSHLSRLFLHQYLDTTLVSNPEKQEHVLKSSEGTIKFTSHWLPKQLTVHLQSHMSSKCIHKNFSTLW